MTMKQQSSRFTVPDWLKWPIIVLLILFFITAVMGVWLYSDAQNDKNSQDQEARTLAIQNTALSTVQNVTVYHGEETVHIVEGTEENGSEGLAFVQADQQSVLEYVKAKDVLSMDGMKSQWRSSCESCNFKKVQYAFEEGEPVFELTYIDEQNRYVFDYFTLTGESFDQRFAFKQNN
ncbi:DUF5590 domain-containing protein [Halobacillus salinus]|nr:DUF5590 domain-containing protein [Halobacillus salinus]